MTQLSPTRVSISGGQITIDAEVLAPKLGLSIEALKENMANGLVTIIVEADVNEEAGRTRLTFRYRAQVWRVVVEVDGRLVEDPTPARKPTLIPRDRFSLLDTVRATS